MSDGVHRVVSYATDKKRKKSELRKTLGYKGLSGIASKRINLELLADAVEAGIIDEKIARNLLKRKLVWEPADLKATLIREAHILEGKRIAEAEERAEYEKTERTIEQFRHKEAKPAPAGLVYAWQKAQEQKEAEQRKRADISRKEAGKIFGETERTEKKKEKLKERISE
jgi:hypothetical protein